MWECVNSLLTDAHSTGTHCCLSIKSCAREGRGGGAFLFYCLPVRQRSGSKFGNYGIGSATNKLVTVGRAPCFHAYFLIDQTIENWAFIENPWAMSVHYIVYLRSWHTMIGRPDLTPMFLGFWGQAFGVMWSCMFMFSTTDLSSKICILRTLGIWDFSAPLTLQIPKTNIKGGGWATYSGSHKLGT